MYLFLNIFFIILTFVQGQDELFEKYDEDNNERLNPIEFGKLLNEKLKGMGGGKGKNMENDFSANSMPNLEIFKGIDTNNDGEIDDEEFEAQRELFDFMSRMPNLDEDDDEELDEKAIVDRLVEESVKEMGNEKIKKENSQNENKENDKFVKNNLKEKINDKKEENKIKENEDENSFDDLKKFEISDKCLKEDEKCNKGSKEDKIIEEKLEDNEIDSLDKKIEL
ncbi:hypothetical protein ACQ4LE_001193 [Meloidogyne hapla]